MMPGPVETAETVETVAAPGTVESVEAQSDVKVEIVSDIVSELKNEIVADVKSESVHWDDIDNAVLEESSPGIAIVITEETEELLNEFEDLWTGTYPQLCEAVEQANPVAIADLVENTITNTAEQSFLDKLIDIGELLEEGSAPVDSLSGYSITGITMLEDSAPEDTVIEESGHTRKSYLEDTIPGLQSFAVPDAEPGPTDLRLGQLLVDLGLITKELLQHSIVMSVEMSLSVGRILIMSGWLTSAQLQWAVQLQSLLKDNIITMAVAHQVSELMSCSGMTIQRALNCAGQPGALRVMETRATRLGDLLTEAELVSGTDFKEALLKAQTLGLPVGRYLLISGLITGPLLETVVNAQRFIRDGKISREKAILAIQQAARRQYELKKTTPAVDYGRVPIRSMRLGELLTLAGIITDVHLEYAIEFGLRCNMSIGQVLIDFEILTQRTLDIALNLQALVAKGSLEPIDAAYTLIDIHHHGYTMSTALKRNRTMGGERKSLSFEQFIASMELISAPQIEESIEIARRSPLFVSKALVFSGAMSEETAQIALLCHFYVRENMLTAEEALLLFNLCHRTGLSVEDGLTELGLTMRSQPSNASK
jgi:hypothetical protein